MDNDLVGGWSPLRNRNVNWDDDNPNGKIKYVPNHQPVLNCFGKHLVLGHQPVNSDLLNGTRLVIAGYSPVHFRGFDPSPFQCSCKLKAMCMSIPIVVTKLAAGAIGHVKARKARACSAPNTLHSKSDAFDALPW